MPLPLAIAAVVLADLVLIGLLALVMSRAARLTPHEASTRDAAAPMPVTGPGSRRLHAASRPARHAGAAASTRS
jgi:hypothetical protein